MPPKVHITKEAIVQTAVSLVRTQGADALNARAIALELGCSTQPIFSNFATMDALRQAVVVAAEILSQDYIDREMARAEYPPYKASGMAYIRFAKEEKELFKLLYMRDRTREVIPEETDLTNQMQSYVQDQTGLAGNEAKLFHLEMWAYVHGIAVMLATDYLDLDWSLVSKMITDAYQGLKKQFERK